VIRDMLIIRFANNMDAINTECSGVRPSVCLSHGSACSIETA